MKKKALLSSLLTIALCFSLIAGSTFALFTSESKTDITATSATVDVKAVINEASLVLKSMEEGQLDVEQPGLTFKTGGTAEFDAESNLTLTYMVPGDSVEFDIDVTNNSNVDVKYRVKWAVEGELVDALVATADGNAIVNNTTAWQMWTAEDAAADNSKTIRVVVDLPEEVGNEFQDKTAKITFVIEAIQGNAKTVDVATAADLKTAMANAAAAGEELEVTLMDDITLTESLAVTTDTVIDANGKTITASTGNAEGSRAFNVSNDGFDVDFTLKNATVVNASGWSERFISYNDSGKLTVENVTINGGFNYAVNLPANSDNATVTVKDCHIEAAIVVNVWGENSNITVDGCTFVNTATDTATVTFGNDGEYTAKNSSLYVISSKIGANDVINVAVCDNTGTLHYEISSDSVVEGVEVAFNVAKAAYPTSTQFYSCATLQEAIDLVANDAIGEAHLLADVDEDVEIKAGDVVVIDLNGFAYTGTITNEGTLTVKGAAAGSLNIEGNGTVTYA